MTSEELFATLKVETALPGEHHHTRDGWVQLRTCPNCGSDNFHLGFNRARRYFVCWKCGGQKTYVTLKKLGASREQIQAFLGERDEEYVPSVKPAGKLLEPKQRGPLLRAHRDYLRSRNYDPTELARLWDLEGLGLVPRLSWRIYIPIVQQGKRVSWTSRSIGNAPLRYISASAVEETIPHKECLYGIDYARHSVLVVEGPADVWRIGPGAVGLFGTAYTPAQVHKLSRFPYRFLLFDNEVVAQRQAQKLAEQLSCFPGKTTVLACDDKDPGDMKPQDVAALRKLCKLPRL